MNSNKFDDVQKPKHYNSHPSGVECIEITEHYNFNIGNVIKYLWRYLFKTDPIKDLKKAAWYINREIDRLQQELSRKDQECIDRDNERNTVRCTRQQAIFIIPCLL